MKFAALAVGACIAFSALWYVGETHRHDCVMEHRSSCSVLPWDDGHLEPVLTTAPVAAPTPAGLEGQMLDNLGGG